jgi:sugar/nucleoside kinase (ribokinase family)
MKTIAVYGNIVVDNIYETDIMDKDAHAVQCSDYAKALGGVANVAASLTALKHKVTCCAAVSFEDVGTISDQLAKERIASRLQGYNGHTATASILSFKRLAEKQSMVAWGCSKKYKPEVIQADWHHIAYLDALPLCTNSFLNGLENNVSADLCIGSYTDDDRERLRALMKDICFVFMSDHEADSFFEYHAIDNVADVATIIHHAGGSDIYCEDGKIEVCIPPVDGVNVLGAGDVFASRCIDNLLKGFGTFDAVRESHEFTTKVLCQTL